MKRSIKYQYAENSSGERVHISTVSIKDSSKEKYTCIGCKKEIIPRLGDIRVHHFSHKNDVHNCSKETYLHELGKKTFYETYLQCLKDNKPFYMVTSLFTSLSLVCKYYQIGKSKNCIKEGINKIDLTKYYQNIELEKNQGNFKPDILLKNDYGDSIFIEIAVTHPCEKEKIDSNIIIIEISIKEESDIEIIHNKNLSEEYDHIKFYNFENFSIPIEPFCNEKIKFPYTIILKNKEQHNVMVVKKELCKFIYDNNSIIEKVIPVQSAKIPIVPYVSHIQRGPRINDIDSRMNYKNHRPKKRKR
jgi:hypothetical protein